MCRTALLNLTVALALLTPAKSQTVPNDYCAPLGDPTSAGNLKGSNSFVVCKTGETFNGLGKVTQYFIRCKQDTLRPGWKWVIYCNGDGSMCSCNKAGMLSGSDVSSHGFNAGDHCTTAGSARPGANGCDKW